MKIFLLVITLAIGFAVCLRETTVRAASSFTGVKGGDEREVQGMSLCWAPPGRFRMGSPANEPERRPDEAQVDVTISEGFWIGKYEVKVGSYPANAWGLHDVHGNVFEWCRDWYHWKLPGGVDPDLSSAKGAMNRDGTYSRVRRGGAWVEDGWACRSAFRLRFEPARRSDHIGLRVVVVRSNRS